MLRRLLPIVVVAISLAGCGGGSKLSTTPTQFNPVSTRASTSLQTSSETPHSPGSTEAVAKLGSSATAVPTRELIFATAPPGENVQKDVTLPANSDSLDSEPHLTPLPNLDSDGDGFYDIDEMRTAVAIHAGELEWPPGYIFDPTHVMDAYAGYQGSTFEVGGEWTIIGIPNLCAWQQTWLNAFAAGDQALMDESIRALNDAVDANPMFAAIAADLKDMFLKASLGDPAGMQANILAMNCSAIVFVTTPTPSAP